MKIVNLDDFLKLPSETLFCKITTSGIFEEICIKENSINDTRIVGFDE